MYNIYENSYSIIYIYIYIYKCIIVHIIFIIYIYNIYIYIYIYVWMYVCNIVRLLKLITASWGGRALLLCAVPVLIQVSCGIVLYGTVAVL
jgi:hypothetical protein